MLLLNQVARGDLTAAIRHSGDNEIQRLLAAIQRMQQELLAIVAQVRHGAERIRDGSQELATGNMELSSRTETQASALEETAASMEELTSTVRQNSDNAQHARELAQGASSTAQQGGSMMEQVVSTMTGLNTSSHKIVQRSAAAAKEIKLLIDDSVDQIHRGTDLVQRAGSKVMASSRSTRLSRRWTTLRSRTRRWSRKRPQPRSRYRIRPVN